MKHLNICRIGDCREVMREMIAEDVRVQTCVTSPPYWGLRDYGTAQWEGGDTDCNHANPMPESVTDRCTKAHEYLFLLSKRERYFYDAQAIAEDNITEGLKSGGMGRSWHDHKDDLIRGDRKDPEFNGQHSAFPGKRNRRSVWTVPTAPYAEAHFATFPPALIEPCIMAGSRPGDTVLDPFLGSGTTGQVAQALGRQWIGCELNPAYESLQHKRTAQQAFVLE